MLLTLRKDQWFNSLTSKPTFQPSQKKSPSLQTSHSSTLKKPLPQTQKTPKRRISLEKPPISKENPSLSSHISSKNLEKVVFPVKYPGCSDLQKNPLFSKFDEKTQKIDPFSYHNELFTAERQKLNADELYREFRQKGLYLESFDENTKENSKKTRFIEQKPEENTVYYESLVKNMNIYNENPSFPRFLELPGNSKPPKFTEKQQKSAICIQKTIKGFLLRKKLAKTGKTREIPCLIGKKTLEFALETWNLDETPLEKTQKFQRNPPNSDQNFTETIKTTEIRPFSQDIFTKNDGFSVISLFLSSNSSKIPLFSQEKPLRNLQNPQKSQNPHKAQIPYRSSEIHKNGKNAQNSLISEDMSLENIEYSENFETPSQSFLNKSTNHKDSTIKESISDDLHEEILEESVIKHKENSFNNQYEDEKFESISEEKSIRNSSKKHEENSSIEEKINEKHERNEEKHDKNEEKHDENEENLKKNSKILESSLKKTNEKHKKSVNFEPERENSLKSLLKTSEILKTVQKASFLDENPNFPNEEENLDDALYRDPVAEAKRQIEQFNRKDGELIQLKNELFLVYNELNLMYNTKKNHKTNEVMKERSEDLYLRFQAEFNRLMELKSANEALSLYEKIDEKNRLQSLVFQDLPESFKENKENIKENVKENSSKDWKNCGILLNNLQNKQEIVFKTLLSLIGTKSNEETVKNELEQIKASQMEILLKFNEFTEKKLISFEKPAENEVNPLFNEKIQIKPFFAEKIQIKPSFKENPDKNFEKNLEKCFEKTPEKNSAKTEEKSEKIEKSAEKSEEIEEEYLDDFEMSTPNVPNIPFEKSFERQKSQSSLKSPISHQITHEISLENMKSLSVISSDKEVENDEELSSVSWQNIQTPLNKQVNLKNSQEKIVENIADFLMEKILEDVLAKDRLFPIRNYREIEQFIEKKMRNSQEKVAQKKEAKEKEAKEKEAKEKEAKEKEAKEKEAEIDIMKPAFNREELENELISPSPLAQNHKKASYNMENFEEKSPTKLHKKRKGSIDDLLRSSLEMSVRNEGFFTETEKSIRGLESKLKRRNNSVKIAESVNLINEDLYNRISLFNETDLKEKGEIIVEAFNEQMKMNMIKEFNEMRKKEAFIGDFKQKKFKEIVEEKFNRICGNSKKNLLKNIENQLKENEEYVNVKGYEFEKLWDYCRKEKYPNEEEENLEVVEWEIGENWDLLKKIVVEDVVNECVKDVMMEMNRIGNKKKNTSK